MMTIRSFISCATTIFKKDIEALLAPGDFSR